jgi:metal-responsive CopG/Arc/MetJ family transcriptional regulator
MKTAISIPDRVYGEAERLAKRLKKSRSQLYSEAVAEYVARRDEDQMTAAMNRACEAADPSDAAWIAAAVNRTLQRSEW